jgi:cyanate lyase
MKDLSSHFDESFFPERGLGPMPPTDALLYRLYESQSCFLREVERRLKHGPKVVMIFGYPLKSVIHEKFGDG